MGYQGKQHLLHRLIYIYFKGPVPEGMEVEHECNQPACAEIEHLRPMTHRDNQRRGRGWAGQNARKTHCPYGHEYTDANTYRDPHGWRTCRTCHRRSSAISERR